MGPRLISRGTEAALKSEQETSGASMGPRLISRGTADLVAGWFRARVASMGPRLISRGTVQDCACRAAEHMLQWGRD